ncbi:O-antigen ligase family protein [Priestia megaterium]
MDSVYVQNRKPTVLFCLFVLVTLSKYNVNIGFSLKPYMIFLFALLLLSFASFYVYKLQAYEVLLLLFYLFYCMTGAFSLYPEASLRIMLGVLLILACYFLMKYVIAEFHSGSIKRALTGAGILFNSVSLLLYIAGLQAVHFQFASDVEIIKWGVMIDRSYPRLIGVLDDPNIYVFYNTLFFTYFLTNSDSTKNKVGLLLSTLTSVLTFSRGGLIAMVAVLILYLLITRSLNSLKTALSFVFLFGVLAFIAHFMTNFNVFTILTERADDFLHDGGSGRFSLWSRAFEFFSSHPFAGIGAFNFSEYNLFYYGEALYVHNTFLEILSETGMIGFCLYFSFLLLVLLQLLKQKIHKQEPYLFLTFIGFLLQMMSLSLIVNELFFLYLALLSGYLRNHQSEESAR